MAGQANQRAMNWEFINGVHRLTTPISASVPRPAIQAKR